MHVVDHLSHLTERGVERGKLKIKNYFGVSPLFFFLNFDIILTQNEPENNLKYE